MNIWKGWYTDRFETKNKEHKSEIFMNACRILFLV